MGLLPSGALLCSSSASVPTSPHDVPPRLEELMAGREWGVLSPRCLSTGTLSIPEVTQIGYFLWRVEGKVY